MDLPFVLVIAGITFLAGIVLALIISTAFAKKPNVEQQKPLEDSGVKPVELQQPLAAAPQPPVEPLQISWRLGDEIPAICLQGKEIHDPSELSETGRAWLVDGLESLQAWLQNAPAQAPAPTQAPAPAPVRTVGLAAPLQEGPKLRINPVDALVNAVSTDVPAALPPKSIPAQVEEILQAQIRGTPLNTRGIHITDGPGGAVDIQVGLEHYTAIDNVPDPEIKSAIRAAVAEWSQKSLKK